MQWRNPWLFGPWEFVISIECYVCCGTGGFLACTVDTLRDQVENTTRDINLYGKEINDETYAICKSDMMIKGNDPKNIKMGSTLSTDEFAGQRFDFCLSNPPYGKSWATEQKYIKEGSDVIDSRFIVDLADYWGNSAPVDATPRSSDGQLLFLMEMVSKMKSTASSPLGSRIASVHNGSSLFTGDAGSGESNIRRYLIENDMLDAIVQLPNNLFYNTGITTYIWLLNNNKPETRQGKVQLIDASLLFKKLRKNLGNKNCEFSPEHITEITQTYLDSASIDRKLNDQGDAAGIAAKVFNNDDFGYYKVNIERPDRRKAQFKADLIEPLRFDKALREPMEHLYAEYEDVYKADFFSANEKAKEKEIISWCEDNDISLNAKAKAKLLSSDTWDNGRLLVALGNKLGETITKEYSDFNTWYDESAEKVIKKIVKFKQEKLDELLHHLCCTETDLVNFGYYAIEGKKLEFITYESSTDLRDAESIPLTYLNDKTSDSSGNQSAIHQYFLDEVQPHVDEAWINLDSTKIGYEISFNKYFYQHKVLRTMDEVASDIINLEKKAEGLIADILGVENLGLDLAKVKGE